MARILRLRGHSDSVISLAASSEGGLLASGSEDGCIAVHDVAAALSAPAAAGTIGPAFLWRPPAADQGSSSGAAAEEDPEPITALAFHPRDRSVLFAAAGPRLLRVKLPLSDSGGNAGAAGGGGVTVTALLTEEQAAAPGAHEGDGADEINSISVHASGSRLAAADDGGAVRVYELPASGPGPARRVAELRGAHPPIASAVAFRRHRPWELLAGGLDSRVTRWDFSTRGGRLLGAWTMGAPPEGEAAPAGGSDAAAPRLCNPPMVHCLSTPPGDGPAARRLVAAACGDGAVAVFSVEAAGGGGGSSTGTGSAGKRKPVKQQQQQQQRQQQPPQAAEPAAYAGQDVSLWLGREAGGHARPASAVAFLSAAGGGRYVASGGEDRRLVVWDWQAATSGSRSSTAAADTPASAGEAAAAAGAALAADSPGAAGAAGVAAAGERQTQQQQGPQGQNGQRPATAAQRTPAPAPPPLVLSAAPAPSAGAAPCAWSHNHGRKVNAIASLCFKRGPTSQQQQGQQGQQQEQAQQQAASEFLCVADTSKTITLYTVLLQQQ
ncbi:hypothetical protein Rsub_03993 [Raphidocelis subcapitata]|uniref:Uncharacterized protein n=1 Tax=Raphidocelis subcapitata TaxID=307507 RepID=A0A2V0NWH5_9CHLO|nr:hypothetical protein Rsub_03993 [Raphidocelis subcapitata]|eukprot:GBF91689.1 hypothetical protein Rsub_03993 [Raphidocelis subcapitata]